jgi:hypothetical protein
MTANGGQRVLTMAGSGQLPKKEAKGDEEW